MRRKMFGILALVAFCGALIALSGGVATAGEDPEKGPSLAVTGGIDDLPKTPPLFERAYCESDCCYASCSGADDCSVSCSNGGCSASGGGQSASYLCDAE